MLEQCLEQRLFAPREIDRQLAQPGLATAGIVAQATVLDEVDRPSGRTSQQRMQAGSQLAQVERLEQVIVGAGL